MIKLLIRLLVLLVIGVLVYNYFLGTPEEKESSKTIFREVKQLGKSAWALLKSEKSKMEEGKYDAALDKIGILYDELEERARSGKDRESLDRIMELDRQRRALNDRLTQLEEDQAGARTSAEKQQAGKEEERLKSDLRSLFAETERLMNDMEQ
ncbi:MAG: hypothetical protein KBG02_01745 [Haliscomenobacter sp.]|nr:hypothetical protein [Haliscomenobacter sp.]MBP9075553.1 hypothetical protein [Haliscomenobacter sp.]MBP9875241.1 hypothetical protein [Haliscomenobacter sp.]